jgi:hypothetical protein
MDFWIGNPSMRYMGSLNVRSCRVSLLGKCQYRSGAIDFNLELSFMAGLVSWRRCGATAGSLESGQELMMKMLDVCISFSICVGVAGLMICLIPIGNYTLVMVLDRAETGI